MSHTGLYVEKDPTATGAAIALGGSRYWLAGYVEGEGIWDDDAGKSNPWGAKSNASSIWTDDPDTSSTWS